MQTFTQLFCDMFAIYTEFDDFFLGASFAALCIALYLVYRYFTRNYDYWTLRGIGGPKPIIFFGTTIYDFIGMKHKWERKWLQKYGKIYGMYRRRDPYITVGEPDIVKRILVEDFALFMDKGVKRANKITNQHLFRSNGEEWRRLRPIMTPVFSLAKLRRLYPLISDCVKQRINDVMLCHKNDANIDMKTQVGKFINGAVSSCSMGFNVSSKDLDEFVVNAKRVFDFKFLFELSMTLLPLSWMRFLVRFGAEAQIGNEFFINIGRHLMQNWTRYTDNPVTMIDILMNVYTGTGVITEEELLAEVWVFYVASYGMTATNLSSLIHVLTVNEDIQQRLYEELTKNFGDDFGAEIDYEVLASLPYMNAVVSEGLRLYVPPLRLPRIVSQDYPLGDTGITVPKGMRVEIPLYAIHMCEEYYPNADQFIPERFLPENKDKLISNTYFPFGNGPRTCLGSRFSTMQIKIFLAHFLLKYRLYATAKTDKQMAMFKHTNFQGPSRVIVGVEERLTTGKHLIQG